MESTTQSAVFPGLARKSIEGHFDQANSSGDGGAVLLKGVDEDLGLSAALAACLRDARQPGKVQHEIEALFRQRLFAIALGHPDANDAEMLADDPIQKLLVGRDPIRGPSLASQSTLCRFENGVNVRDLYRLADTLADCVIDRHRRRLGRRTRTVTIDFDPTDDPTHGQQEFSFYHGYYRAHCYLPLVGTLQFNGEARQSLVAVVLRPGNAKASEGLVAILGRLIAKLRRAFPRTRLRVRLDGGFGTPEVLDFLDEEDVEYVVGLANWAPLKKKARRAMAQAKRSHRETGRTTQVYGETMYQTTTTWPWPRRVVFKAEVVDYEGRSPRPNLRLVVTNMTRVPKDVYRFYCQRGDAENRIKELKHDLSLDRTSCSSFLANQFRVQLVAAAYVLLQELGRKARHTTLANAQVGRLRDALLKLPVWVEESCRRIVLHLPRTFGFQPAWLRVAKAVGGHSP